MRLYLLNLMLANMRVITNIYMDFYVENRRGRGENISTLGDVNLFVELDQEILEELEPVR